MIGNGLARPDGEDNLKYYNLNEFSDGFRQYDAADCSDEVNTCLRQMHENAKRCIGLWRQQAGERFQHCITNDAVVQNATKDWQVPSFKWHKAMDQCLAGREAPTQQALESLAIQSAAMSYYSRRKRDAAASEEVTQCWRSSRQQKTECLQKAAQCTAFAHCYGEGAEPTNESAKRWFNHVKRLRAETQQKSKIYIMHMGHCLRNEPHTSGDHGDHHGMHH